MKKFLFRVSLFLLITLGVVAGAIQLIPTKYLLAAHDYESVLIKKEIASKQAKGEYGKANIVLGDSRLLQGIESKKINAVNLAVAGGNSMISYTLLKSLDISLIDTIYIGYNPYHFGSDEFLSVLSRYGDEEVLNQVVDLIKNDDFDSVYLSTYNQNKIKYSFRNIKALLYSSDIAFNLFSPSQYIRNIKKLDERDELILSKWGSNIYDDASCAGKDFDLEATLEDTLNFYSSPINDYYFEKILDFAKQANKEVIFISMPFREGNARPPEVYYSQYYNHIQTLMKTRGYTTITPHLLYPCELYRDEGHLNKQGVEKFTSFLKSYLKIE